MLCSGVLLLEGMKKCDVLENVVDNFPDLSKHHSFMKQHLTPKLYEDLKDLRTSNGVSLDDCIQTGVDDPTLDIGLVAGDEECFTLYQDLFYPVIQSYHNGYNPLMDTHPTNVTTHPHDLPIAALDETYVISSRVRTGRSFRGFPYSPSCNRQQRRQVEKIARQVLSEMKGENQGKYYSCPEMTPDETKELVTSHYLFAKPASDFMRNAGMGRDWPDSRGIFFNKEKSFLVWVNEEDHIRIMAMQKGGNLKAVFSRFCSGAYQFGEILKDKGYEFQQSTQLGFMCTCPSNLGTAMRASVHIRLPELAKHNNFDDIVKKMRLEKRGTGGEYQPSAGPDTFDISNLDRLGKSEVELVQLLYDGVKILIQMEKLLEHNLPVEHLVPA